METLVTWITAIVAAASAIANVTPPSETMSG